MRIQYFSLLFILLAVLVTAEDRVHAQANVTESESSTIYVDANSGSDNNVDALAGSNVNTAQVPLKTIQSAINVALANNVKGIGTKVVVNAGVYRESIDIGASSNQTAAPITIQAATIGTAVIAGSDVVTNWSQESDNPAIYTHSWAYNFGNCPVPNGWPANLAPIVRRTEMVFVNGTPLTQVMSYGELRPGTFYVDEAGNVIDISPAPNTNMSSATVETATRRQVLNIAGRSNVVVRGVVLEHAASCINDSGAVIANSTNVLVDGVQAVWNNWGGLQIDSSHNVTVQNSVASHNGGIGLQGNYLTNAVYKFNQTDFNNWRGAQSALYDWGMGGIKLLYSRTATMENDYAYRNQAQGLWFDTDNENATITGSTSSGNVLAAVQLERNQGPVTLENSKMCDSGLGLNVLTVEKLTVKNNSFYNNSATNAVGGEAEIFVQGTPGGQVIRNWQTGESYRLFTTNMVLDGNQVEDASGGQHVFGTYLSGGDWSKFADSLNAGGNRWYDPHTSSAFKVENGHLVTLSGWQHAVGTDYSSSWGSSSAANGCGAPNPSPADFQINLNNRSFGMSGGKAEATARVESFGFGTVNLTVTGLPAHVSASLSQSTIGSGTVTVTLRASKGAANKTVPITLVGYANGHVHTVTFLVHVAA